MGVFLLKKLWTRRVAIVAAAATITTAGAAYAYWSTTGTGTGTGSVASSNGTVVLHGSITTALKPGTSSPVAFTADNPGTSSLFVGTVHLEGVATDKVGCLVDDFTMPDVTQNQRIAAGASGVALTNGGTMTMADTNVSQDACKGAAITLTLSSD